MYKFFVICSRWEQVRKEYGKVERYKHNQYEELDFYQTLNLGIKRFLICEFYDI